MSNKKIVGIFVTPEETVVVIKKLKENGYENHEISVLGRQRESIDLETDNLAEDSAGPPLTELGLRTFPGSGPLLARGPIAVTLSALSVGNAKGGVIEALVDMGVNREEAKQYKEYLEKGKVLVMVDGNEERSKHASRTFSKHNSVASSKHDDIGENIKKEELKVKNSCPHHHHL